MTPEEKAKVREAAAEHWATVDKYTYKSAKYDHDMDFTAGAAMGYEMGLEAAAKTASGMRGGEFTKSIVRAIRALRERAG